MEPLRVHGLGKMSFFFYMTEYNSILEGGGVGECGGKGEEERGSGRICVLVFSAVMIRQMF